MGVRVPPGRPFYGIIMQKFVIGDVVKFIKRDKNSIFMWGATHIIAEVVYSQGKFKYSTNIGAWFMDTDFELIHKANRASLTKLTKDLDGEL